MAEMAFRKSGQYTGNGTSQTIASGYSPKVVKISSANGKYFVQRHVGGNNKGMIALGASEQYRTLSITGTDGITITDTGFTVGASTGVNELNVVYEWEVVIDA